MINLYINSISKRKEFNKNNFEDQTVYKFTGDGYGDFEKWADSATKEVISSYILHCERQIELAKDYLEVIEKNS